MKKLEVILYLLTQASYLMPAHPHPPFLGFSQRWRMLSTYFQAYHGHEFQTQQILFFFLCLKLNWDLSTFRKNTWKIYESPLGLNSSNCTPSFEMGASFLTAAEICIICVFHLRPDAGDYCCSLTFLGLLGFSKQWFSAGWEVETGWGERAPASPAEKLPWRGHCSSGSTQ